MLIGTYLNILVSNITSGVFSGMGRPMIATILSFGLELPLTWIVGVENQFLDVALVQNINEAMKSEYFNTNLTTIF